MTWQARPSGFGPLLVSMTLVATATLAVAADPPREAPATQPTTQPVTQDALERLRRLKAESAPARRDERDVLAEQEREAEKERVLGRGGTRPVRRPIHTPEELEKLRSEVHQPAEPMSGAVRPDVELPPGATRAPRPPLPRPVTPKPDTEHRPEPPPVERSVPDESTPPALREGMHEMEPPAPPVGVEGRVPTPAMDEGTAGQVESESGEEVPEEFVGPPQRLKHIVAPAPAGFDALPTEDAGGLVDVEGKTRRPRDPNEPGEWFNFSKTPWETVIQQFVERIGKPLMDPDSALVIGGELTYISNEQFTKDEALDELNFILHEKGYRFVERPHHIYLVPLSDMPTMVPLDKVFASIEQFNAAAPRDMDYVTVYYQVHDRPAQVYVDMFGDALGDYSRISALPESNQIKITALAKDVRKFLTLKDRIDISPQDPRKLEFFDIQTNAAAIERMVRDFLRIGSAGQVGQMRMVRDPATGQMIPQPVGGAADEVQIVADERTNSIIVKATEEKIAEIRDLIRRFDQKPDLGKFETKVIPIRHADAVEVASLIQNILQQEQGQFARGTPQWQMQRQMQLQQQQQQQLQRIQAQQAAQRAAAARRGRVPQAQPQPQPVPMDMNFGATPEDILTEGIYERAKKTIRLVADTRTNSLIVYATDWGFERVEQMLEIIDQPLPDKLRALPVVNVKVADIAALFTQLAESVTASSGRGAPVIVPDEGHNQFYVIAERDQMEKVEDLLTRLDVPGPERVRHIVELKNLRPSAVADMVERLLSSQGRGSTAAPVSGPRGAIRSRMGPGAMPPGVAPTVSATEAPGYQVIALDAAQVLIVECSDEDWAKIEPTIRLWDEGAITNTPRLETFEVKVGDADTIAVTLSNLYRNYEHPVFGRTAVTIQADGDTILVYGIRPAIEEVGALIAQLDVERPMDKIQILPLAHADAQQIATQLQQLFGGGRGPRVPGGGAGAGPLIQAEPVTNSLLVQADKNDLEKIQDFAMKLDQEFAARQPEQRFFTINWAQPQELAAAIQNIFGTTGKGPRGMASQVKALAAGRQVIVEAPPEQMKSIEAFVLEYDNKNSNQVEVKPYKLPGADVAQIAQSLGNAFQGRPPRPDKLQARFQADTTTEQIIVSAPPDMWPEIEKLMRDFAAVTEDLTLERKLYAITNADATQVANKVRDELVFYVSRTKGQILAQRINVTSDERQNQVIVSAPKFVHAMAQEMIGKLDQPDNRVVRKETITLRYADASAVAGTLRPIFQEKARQLQQNKSYVPVQLTPDTATNAVIIYGGDEDDHVLITEEIARIDQGVAEQDVPPTTITLQNADANQVAQMIGTMFRAQGGRSQQSDVQVSVSNGALVVKAPRKKLDEIRELVAQIDTPDDGTGGVQVKTYDLKVMNAVMVQVAVQGFLQQLRPQTRPGQLKPGAFAEPTTNSLVVMAPPETLPFIDMLIESFERKTPPSSATRTYDLRNVRAEQVASNVDQMLRAKVAEREGQRKGNVSTAVFAFQDANRLVVMAPDEYQALAADMIATIDQEAKTGEVVHIIPLAEGDATQMAQSLTQIIQGRAGGKGGATSVRVTADAGSNSLIVAGLPKDIADIEGYVESLEQNSIRVPELQSFTLRYAAPTRVKETLTDLFAGGKGGQDAVTITSDEFNNRLIVTANRRKMRQVEKFIAQLDVEPERTGGLLAGGKIVRFIDINRGDASDIAWDVRKQFPDEDDGGPSIEADWYGEYITVKCRESELDQIVSLIREFESRARPVKKVFTTKISDPRVMEYLKGRHSDLNIVQPPSERKVDTLIEYLRDEDEPVPGERERRERNERNERERRPAASRTEAPAETEQADAPAERELSVGSTRSMPYLTALPLRRLLLDEAESDVLGADSGGSGRVQLASDEPAHDLPVGVAAPESPRAAAPAVQLRGMQTAWLDEIEREVVGVSHATVANAPAPNVPREEVSVESAPQPAPPAPARVQREWKTTFGVEDASSPTSDEQVAPAPAMPSPAVSPAVRKSASAPRGSQAKAWWDLIADAADQPTRQPVAALAADEPPAAPAKPTTRAAPPAEQPPAPARAPVEPGKVSSETTGSTPIGIVPQVAPPAPAAAEGRDAKTIPSPLPRERVNIIYRDDGTVIIEGPKDQVDDIKDTIQELEQDLAVGEVIRIFKFRYGDVTAAAEILQLMFDVQQRQLPIPQPQQPQQPQQQRRGEAREGGERDQQSLLEQMRQMVGGRDQQGQRQQRTRGQIRMATDPGHNYLIVRCEETMLPEIRQLLRELDIPPGEVQIKVFQLQNLVADETADNIKDVLGISKAQQRRGGQTRQPRGGPQQQQLIEMLQQQMVSVPGVEGGAKVERVEIVSNATTNSLMVSAPPEVMGLIERVINELESLEGRNVVRIHYYPLKRARVEDLLPLLQSIFDSGSGGGRSGGGGPAAGLRRGGGGGDSPSQLGPVSLTGDTRTNTVIFTCENKDVPVVEEQIRRLDIEERVAEAETYVCQWGDASEILATIEPIFAAARGGRGGDAAGASGPFDLRMSADPITNTITVWGSLEKRDLVFGKIEQLDKLSQKNFREIPVLKADAEKLAATLTAVFTGGGQAAARPGPRRRGPLGGGASDGPAVQSAGRVTIIGDKPGKKLLVRAPDEVFKQVQELAATLDNPSSDLELKSFELRYADAQAVVDSVKAALAEYLQIASATGGSMDLGAFTAMPDTRTNSITVVGSPEIFAFVAKVLSIVDVPTPANQKKEFRVFQLDRADAQVVADAINGYAAGGSPTGAPGGGRPGRFGAGASAGTSGRELSVTATADVSTNSVFVFGKAEDIALVETAVIERLETSRTQFASIPVRYVPPSQLVNYIMQFMESGTAGAQPGRGGRSGEVSTRAPQIVPNDDSKTLVVRGTARQIEEVRELVERFDSKDFKDQSVRVVEIPRGQDAQRLASEIQRVINEAEQQRSAATGRPPRQITIGADTYSNSLIVASPDQAMYGMVETLVGQLGQIGPGQAITRVIEVRNLSASDAERIINELQQNRGVRGSGSTPRPRGGGMRAPSSNPPAPRPSGTTPSSPQPRRPSGPRGGSGGGALAPAEVSPLAAWTLFEPVVGTALVLPTVGAAIGASVFEIDETPATKPGQDAPATRPARARAPRAERAERAERDRPTTAPAPLRERAAGPAAPGSRDRALDEAEREVRQAAARRDAARRSAEPEVGTTDGHAEAAPHDGATTEPADDGEPLTGVTGSLRGEVLASAIDSQRIVITGDEADLDFIESVLRMMEASTPAATIEVFALEHAKATALAPIIDKAMKAKGSLRGATGPGDAFSVNAEGRSNSLIVAANEVMMEEIAHLVARLDKDTGGSAPDIRTVPLRNIRASQAVAILKPQVERLNKMREVPADSQASISAVDVSNSILIIGTPTDAADIQRLIEAVDVEVEPETDRGRSFLAADVILVQLENARAEDVAKTLTDLIEEQQKNAREATGDRAGVPFVKKLRLRLADGRELPELDLERPIKVIPEKGTNALIIFSNQKNNEALQAIVKVFDTLPIGADTDVKAFVLRYASAEQLATLVKEVFDNKVYLSRPGEGGQSKPPAGLLPPVPEGLAAQGLPYPLVVQHDVRSNTIVVIGRRDAVVLAGGLIGELDRPTMELGVKARVLPLKNATAKSLADKLKQILDDRAAALGGDQNKARDNAVIEPDERANALIVVATDEMQTLIGELVDGLDGAQKFANVDTRYRQLKFADAAKMQSMLDETFKAREEGEKRFNQDAADTLKILADTRSNSLVLTGTRDYLRDAESLIVQLDRQYDPTVVFAARKVRLNTAPNVAALLKDMIENALTRQDSNLKGTPIHVTADPVTDTLLIAAAREDQAILDRWIEILDRPSEVGRMVRIIPLVRGNAEQVAQAVTDIFTQRGGGGETGRIDVTVTQDKTTNSVVAFGPGSVLDDVETFVRQLDTTEPGGSTVVRIFRLEQAAAEDAGNLLGNILELRGGTVGGRSGAGGGGSATEEKAKQVLLVFQRQHPQLGVENLKALRSEITVIADVRTNALVVTAPAASMPLMESLIEAVDVPPQDAKIRVFKLRNADAEQMVQMLEKLFERRAAGATGGSAQESERVLSLGETMGGRQEIAFTTDVRTNSVIAAGTPGYLDLVEEMILDLDTQPIKERVTFVYEPRNITAQTLGESLRSFSDAEQQRLQEIGADISASVKQERKIVAIYNEDANRVIIDVDPRFREQVMKVISDLDQQPLQVLIQVLILEVSLDNALDLGVEFAFQDLQWSQAGPNDTTTFDYVGGTDIGAAGSGLGGFTFTITGRDFNFLFRTLQTEGNLNVLSRPQIVAMNNKEAKIDISNDVPYVTGTQTSSTGQISTSVGRQKVGIILTVTPQINPDGFVRMEISQEVSDLTDSTVPVAPGVTSPIFFTREASTTITVRDNETVVLGGLIQSRQSNTETKVPLVGDIPGIGALFRSQSDTSTRRELLLVLTPRVIRSVEEFRRESILERDRLEIPDEEMMSNPLLQGLQRTPADFIEPSGDLLPGRYEEISSPSMPPRRSGAGRDRATPARREAEAPPPQDIYGPVRRPAAVDPGPRSPASYDVAPPRRQR